MRNIISPVLCFLTLFATIAQATIPSAELYPFAGFDLTAVRAKTKAEWCPDSMELREAWHLYGELKGAWDPGAPKPQEKNIAQLDQLKSKLEALPKPQWFIEALESPLPGKVQFAEMIGDQVFEQQKSTPEYQVLKALAIIYLTEHELDRKEAALNAHKYLTAFAITHPWDWEVAGLYSRLLIDEQLNGPAWEAAKQSLFLNPEPSLEELKFFAFIGSITAKEKWPEIRVAIRQATTDVKMAEQAIVESGYLYSKYTKLNVVVPKAHD